MTIEDAAASLDTRCRPHHWYFAVGVGVVADVPTLFLYANPLKAVPDEIRHGWNGFPVAVRQMSTVRPLGDYLDGPLEGEQ